MLSPAPVESTLLPPAGDRAPEGASAWVALIRDQNMPAFGATVAAVRDVTGDERATAHHLAQVILQDTALTTKVLKLANSVFYNPSGQSISTISRAIMVLGFDLMADIALGVSLVDAMLAGGVRGRVVQEMARSFHGAVQARALAQMRRDTRAEEIFIATLLSSVGEMAFWCFGGEAAAELDAALTQDPSRPPEDVQLKQLGFRLRQISLGLAREWRLGPLLTAVLEERGRPGPEEQTTRYGSRIAVAAEAGWHSREMDGVLKELGDFVGVSQDELRTTLAKESERAAQIAQLYGLPEAARQIRAPAKSAPSVSAGTTRESESSPTGESAAATPTVFIADPLLQLRILRELSHHIATQGGLNEVVQLALEGILRGVGMERVLFALITANRQQLAGKSALGTGAEALCQRFLFALGGPPDDVFNLLAQRLSPVLLNPESPPAGTRLQRFRMVVGDTPACLAPIIAQGRMIGVIFADRVAGSGALERESFEACSHFAEQVSFAFAAASLRRP
ncbi:MAG: HDOD domain-containing protein [Zoogloeaceae bacterium]|nr:HDOD domain-containing protein [Zoogloeaceae bacterium]